MGRFVSPSDQHAIHPPFSSKMKNLAVLLVASFVLMATASPYLEVPTHEGCCKAFTAQCVSCTMGVTEAEFCSRTPRFLGCSTGRGKRAAGSDNSQCAKFAERHGTSYCRYGYFSRMCPQLCTSCSDNF